MQSDLASPKDKDDPLADHLPGGWSYPDRKPLSVRDLKEGADSTLLSELSEDQMWALALARVSKRPKVLFLIEPSMYSACDRPGLYSQKYALEELRAKTSVGIIIRNMELEHLHPLLGDDEESQDPQTYD